MHFPIWSNPVFAGGWVTRASPPPQDHHRTSLSPDPPPLRLPTTRSATAVKGEGDRCRIHVGGNRRRRCAPPPLSTIAWALHRRWKGEERGEEEEAMAHLLRPLALPERSTAVGREERGGEEEAVVVALARRRRRRRWQSPPQGGRREERGRGVWEEGERESRERKGEWVVDWLEIERDEWRIKRRVGMGGRIFVCEWIKSPEYENTLIFACGCFKWSVWKN